MEVFLVFAEVEVQRVEDVADGDVTIEGRDEEPTSEVVPWYEGRYPLPDLQWYSLVGWFGFVVYLL